MAWLLHQIVIFAFAVTRSSANPIEILETTSYVQIWHDVGSGADDDFSSWRPVVPSGWYFLGDVGIRSHSTPAFPTLLVKPGTDSGALAQPTQWSQVWKDSGSGADMDGSFYRATCPTGYVGVGDVSQPNHGQPTNVDAYRCIKESYTAAGIWSNIWDDAGSGADSDVTIWSADPADYQALRTNVFQSTACHCSMGHTARALNRLDITTTTTTTPSSVSFPFEVLETSDYHQIWNDIGSGADHDFSTWRPNVPEGWYFMGDVSVRSHGQPGFPTYLIKAQTDQSALAAPTGLTWIWNDAGSGADWDGSVWQVNCPTGYRDMGVVTERHHGQPSISNYRCVKEEYTMAGVWEWVWHDGGSGADRDFSAWQKNPASGANAYWTRLFNGHATHATMGGTAYVLQRPTAQPVFNMETAVKSWAPLWRFHEKELFWVSSVHFFTAGSVLVDSSGNQVSFNAHTDTWSTSFTLPNNNGEGYRFISVYPSGAGCLDAMPYHYGNTNFSAPTYALVEAANGGFRRIIYVTYFPFNVGKEACVGLEISGHCLGVRRELGWHVGDFETVTVVLTENGEMGPTGTGVIFNAHGDETFVAGSDVNTVKEDSRLRAYFAEGSHGTWRSAARHVYSEPRFAGIELSELVDYTSGIGKRIDSLEDMTTIDLTQPLPFWLRFKGRWGNDVCGDEEPLSGVYPRESGPTGPL